MVVLVRVLAVAVVVVVLLEVDTVLVVIAVAVVDIGLDCGVWVIAKGINNAMINTAQQIHAKADKMICGYMVVINAVSVIKCPIP